MENLESYSPTAEEMEHWEEYGFIIRKNVFTEDECREFGQRAGELATGERPLPFENRRLNALVESGEVTDRTGAGAMHSITSPHLYDEIFLKRVRDPRVADVVSGLIGPDLASHNTLFIFKAPGIGLPFPWHQDLWYFQKRFETETTVGTWQTVDDADTENGCLRVIPGSHKWEVLEHDELDGFQQQEFKLARVPEGETGIPVEMPAGSVLWFHSRLLHRSTHNHSDRFRRVYVAHYLSARAVEKSVKWKPPPNLRVRGKTYPGCIRAEVENVLPIPEE